MCLTVYPQAQRRAPAGTQSRFTCFTGTKVQILTQKTRACPQHVLAEMCRNELGLAAIDVPAPALLQPQDRASTLLAAHATQEWLRKMQECAPEIFAFLQGAFRFMEHAREQSQDQARGTQFTCFTSTKVQKLTAGAVRRCIRTRAKRSEKRRVKYRACV